MPHRLEIALKPLLFDPLGASVSAKARDYFGLEMETVRAIHVLTIDREFTAEELERLRTEIFTNPVTQISSFEPLAEDFDWLIWVGYKPGVRDNPGATAKEAVSDLLGVEFGPGEAIYSSHIYVIKGPGLKRQYLELVAREMLANDLIQRWRIIEKPEWDPKEGIGLPIARVILEREPSLDTIPIGSNEELMEISDMRGLALHPADVPVIREYFLRDDVLAQRAEKGLTGPTDVEMEYIAQARSDHCNHNTFRGTFHCRDLASGETFVLKDPFKSCIEEPTLRVKEEKPWVVSVLWDNAGAATFDENHNYVITCETHNSPSNMEAYGGSLTGIVGVYRDPLGTGKGARLVAGLYGFMTGPRDYRGELRPKLHPKRLLDGIIEGVKDGGNKSGVPTVFGGAYFDMSYLGKSLVYCTAIGIAPKEVLGSPSHEKRPEPGDHIVMVGGRVGKDGIHGVTAASEEFGEHIPAGHVQIGDPYTQKKVIDFVVDARDLGLFSFLTDVGGGGLSSAVGESMRFSGGAEVQMEKVPLKYEGLDLWEIWVSESQERMVLAVPPEKFGELLEVAEKHDVEATEIGTYTNTGKLHITYQGQTCAYVNVDLLESGFPRWEFEALWAPPEMRSLFEPVLGPPEEIGGLVLKMLSRDNIASKEWIHRQYDHEVQGGSAVKHYIRGVAGDAAVLRPVLTSKKGLAVSQAVNPSYSKIDTYHMTAATIDEAVRRVVAVGGDLDTVGGLDNFCWPNIQYNPVSNPDGKYKAAQLARSCRALKDICSAYSIPLLSGKDSMYIDGNLKGPFGETRKVSGLPTLQFTTTAIVADVTHCVTFDLKLPGDIVYVLGETRDELGGSEYYELLGEVGLNVPRVDPEANLDLYRALGAAMNEGLVASCRALGRGGIGVHGPMCALAGDAGLRLDLDRVVQAGGLSPERVLFSESAGRFIVSVAAEDAKRFEAVLQGRAAARVGRVTEEKTFRITRGKETLAELDLEEIRAAYQKPFGELV